VTHPFHPSCGREFVFVVARRTWGEDRVFFFGEDGVQRSLPRAWTDAGDVDPFVALAGDRSPFRVVDLLELVGLVAELRGRSIDCQCQGDYAASVSQILPQRVAAEPDH
jgi:hypothetical protein